jgi:hypothetical protein
MRRTRRCKTSLGSSQASGQMSGRLDGHLGQNGTIKGLTVLKVKLYGYGTSGSVSLIDGRELMPEEAARYISASLARPYGLARFVEVAEYYYVNEWGGLKYGRPFRHYGGGLYRLHVDRAVTMRGFPAETIPGLEQGGPHCAALLTGYPALKGRALSELLRVRGEAAALAVDYVRTL